MPRQKKAKKSSTSLKPSKKIVAASSIRKKTAKSTAKSKTLAKRAGQKPALPKASKSTARKKPSVAKPTKKSSTRSSTKKSAPIKARKASSSKKSTSKKATAKATAKKTPAKRKRLTAGLLLFQDDSLQIVENKDKQISAETGSDIGIEQDQTLSLKGIGEKLSLPDSNSEDKRAIKVSQVDSSQSSPFVVNLKENSSGSLPTRKADSKIDNYLKFEEKLAKLENKIVNSLKQNFITPDLRAEEEDEKRSGVKLSFYSAWEAVSSFLSRQGENVVNKILSYFARSQSVSASDNYAENEIVVEDKTRDNKVNDDDLPVLSAEGGQTQGGGYIVPVRQVKINWWQRHSLATSVALFVIAAMLLTVPIKAFTFYQQLQTQKKQVLGASASVFAEVEEALSNLGQFDFSGAEENFNSAASGLVGLVRLLDNYPPLLISVAEVISKEGKYLKSGKALLESARYLAQAGADLSGALAGIKNSADLSLLNKIYLLQQGVVMSKNRFELAYANLQKVDFDKLPDDFKNDLYSLRKFLPTIIKATDQLEEMLALARQLGGESEPQRYLIVFQNSSELRPTGGFMGTIAELDVKNGEVTDLNIPPGGVYDFQGSLKVLLAAPKPLRMMNANWQLQDANWFFDFPTSAKKVLWFYEKAGGPTRDGLIAVNSNLLPQLLAVIGEIKLPDRNVVLTPDNVLFWLQQEVEYGPDKQDNQPKKVIAELTPILLERLENLPPDKFISVLSVFWQALQKKDIQIYHRQADIEDKLKELGWAGEVKSTDKDYLAIVDTNIAGGKTDSFIKQTFYLQTDIDAAGNIINNLRIVKTHTGDPNDLFGGDTNIDYLRVYVPQGAKLVSAQGFYRPSKDMFSDPSAGYSEDDFLAAVEQNPVLHEQSGTRITEEFGKTVFGNWVKVEPGETVEVSLTYRLPFRIEFARIESDNPLVAYFNRALRFLGVDITSPAPLALYTILWQKQSGQAPAQIEHTLSLPADWQFTTVDKLQDKIGRSQKGIVLTKELTNDFFWGGILLKK